MMRIYGLRYGTPPIFHPLTMMFAAFFVIFLFLGYETQNLKSVCVFLGAGLCYYLYIIFPFFEKFCLQGNTIFVKKIRDSNVITIPNDAIFIISYTTIHNSFFLKKRYVVNIVADTIDTVINRLHEDEFVCGKIAYHHGVSKQCIYDNEYIEGRFKNRFIYSFVLDKETQQIFNNLKRTVILPHSLESKISIEENGFEIIIDEDR